MGDTDGSSSAAQRAQDEDDDRSRGIFGRLFEALAGPEQSEPDDGEPRRNRAATGLANLTQLSIEDVMVPKVEIVSLPMDANKETVVDVFRQVRGEL